MNQEKKNLIFRLAVAALIAIVISVPSVLAIQHVRYQRAQLVLECIMSISEDRDRARRKPAPLDVSQANPDYAFEAAALWCDRFVEAGGRGFGAMVLEE